MLQVKYKGIQPSAPIDPTWLGATPGILDQFDVPGASLLAMIGGRAISFNATTGYIQLADGANIGEYLGPLINDANSGFFENKPAFASGLAAYCWGPCGFVTDQIVTSLTYKPGDQIYVGTGAEVGLYTNVPPVPGAVAIGIADSTASAASPSLSILQR